MFKFRLKNGWTLSFDLVGVALIIAALVAYFNQRQLDAIFWALLVIAVAISRSVE